MYFHVPLLCILFFLFAISPFPLRATPAADSTFVPQFKLLNKKGKVVLTVREGDWVIGKRKKKRKFKGIVTSIDRQAVAVWQESIPYDQIKWIKVKPEKPSGWKIFFLVLTAILGLAFLILLLLLVAMILALPLAFTSTFLSAALLVGEPTVFFPPWVIPGLRGVLIALIPVIGGVLFIDSPPRKNLSAHEIEIQLRPDEVYRL